MGLRDASASKNVQWKVHLVFRFDISICPEESIANHNLKPLILQNAIHRKQQKHIFGGKTPFPCFVRFIVNSLKTWVKRANHKEDIKLSITSSSSFQSQSYDIWSDGFSLLYLYLYCIHLILPVSLQWHVMRRLQPLDGRIALSAISSDVNQPERPALEKFLSLCFSFIFNLQSDWYRQEKFCQLCHWDVKFYLAKVSDWMHKHVYQNLNKKGKKII